MSRDTAAEATLGAAGGAGNRLVSEPAFELLFSEIIAYTGAYVSHTAASHATDILRASEAGVEGDEEGGGDEEEDVDAVGSLVDPSPASVGAGQQMLPVSLVYQHGGRIGAKIVPRRTTMRERRVGCVWMSQRHACFSGRPCPAWA